MPPNPSSGSCLRRSCAPPLILPLLRHCVNGRKRKPNGQFIRNKCKNKRRRISSAEHETKAENIAETSDEQTPLPEHAKCCWRDGRRIVKLGYLADQLKAGCSECKNPLNIINTMDETTQGLGSIFTFSARNAHSSMP